MDYMKGKNAKDLGSGQLSTSMKPSRQLVGLQEVMDYK